ncbi:MAG: DUF4178 domain-containing protein [Kofleriaceae bacterium]
MLWILFLMLVVLGGGAVVGIAVNERRRAALPGGRRAALPPGGGPLLERTLRDLRIHDVVTMDGNDYLCEGVVSYDEDGHRWCGARLVDGAVSHWLIVGIERTGATTPRLCAIDSMSVSGYPPEAMVVGELRYTLDKRGTATCKLAGDVGDLGGLKKDRPENHVERCRWWLYSAPGDDSMIIEQWGEDYRVLRGKKIDGSTIDLIPGS